MGFLHGKAGLWLTVLLALQGAGFYTFASRPEHPPAHTPLQSFPVAFGPWTMAQDVPIEQEIQDVLRADDTLNRVYANPSTRATAVLFIAYFRTQRTGATPHSPKNCLPGSGWEPVRTPGTVSISVPGRAEPIVANQYIVARGDQTSVVIYWYQSHNRIVASEYAAKLWTIVDAVRYRRSDTALVKVVVPAPSGDADAAVKTGVAFVRAVYPDLAKQLPI